MNARAPKVVLTKRRPSPIMKGKRGGGPHSEAPNGPQLSPRSGYSISQMSQKPTKAEARAEQIAKALLEGIVAERLYEPHVAAALLGIHSQRADKTLAQIPEEMLPAQWIGPSRGMRRYYGRNLIAYIHASGSVLNEAEAA